MKNVKFDENGLIPAIIHDLKGNVLMLGYMNDESLKKTIETGRVHFWSRSRKKLWLKGESSGHFQEVKEIFLDCDGDTLLIQINQNVASCHEGYYSCFWRKLKNENWEISEKKIFDPQKVYK
ncbi:MAG: phosphoribosyl-AMP cyclohydrolase [Candidatus Omnitrophica bacterium]|nr:phosphoribosyl-AMP cyclohydrolase [Candidatus Omnitrophota bacterium]